MERKRNNKYHEQREAMNKWANSGEVSNALTTADAGGIHIPESVEGEVYEIAKGYGPALRVFDVITTDKAGPIGAPYIDDQDNEAEQRASEADASPVVEPTLGGLTLDDHQFKSGSVIASQKLVRSAGYDFAEKIGNALVKRLALKITSQSMIGAGGANAINGLVNAAAAGLNSTGTGTFNFNNMHDLIDAVDYRVEDDEDGAFFVSREFRRQCIGLKSSDAKWAESFYRVGKQWFFDGFPVHVFPSLPGVATGNVPCMFGDPMAYKLRVVGDPRIYRSLQPSTNDSIEFRAFWDADGDLADPNAIKKLTIA